MDFVWKIAILSENLQVVRSIRYNGLYLILSLDYRLEICTFGREFMRVVGVVAEYNPLHNGHIYHLEQARMKTGASYCVVAMSGNFVQRGGHKKPAQADHFG